MATGKQAIGEPEQFPALQIRRAIPDDAEACGRICYEAFREIAARHNFPPDIPAPEIATGILSMMFSHPGFFCVVAEENGKIVGSNCADERTPIFGIGPITIDPAAQNRSIGRRLMQAVMNRAEERKAPGIRLVQAGYHTRSLSLYTKLGFAVREPLICMQGPAICGSVAGYEVRQARDTDLESCNALCRGVHGHDRSGELSDAIQHGTAVVAESRGRITAYATVVAFFGHAVGETNEDIQAILAAAPAFEGPGILIPARNAELFRWCLQNGLRATQPMTLMTIGLYNEPAGAYFPSVMF